MINSTFTLVKMVLEKLGPKVKELSPNACPLYLRSEPLRLAFPGDSPEGLLPGPQRASSQDPRRLAPGPKEGCPEEGRARCFLPGTPTSRRGVQAPPLCSGGAQTMTNRTRRADAASKRDAPSLHAGQGRPGAGRLLRCERREGRGFQRRGNHAGWTHGSERAAGSGPGQGALLSPGRAHGREPRGTPVFRTEGRRGARRRPTPLGPLSRARCIALLESQPAAAPRVFKQRVGQGRETNKGTYFCSGLPAPERCFRERCAIRLGLRRILLLRPLRKC
ncbi:unnamed protein product [Rangifer tarandus platyrhynchus]|uniref:Uncharacterized protein n=2 Tax=Rangifer tarandus platyrhynchus TaxID=3082113 RepID=A0ACB0FE83_RANTA|nr:unnamed protein product [Rangifer tarandus platyrhynchus]CAI9711395.1 unnamed protein product [Rangifer tarandus platyrhynchus]